ncbi:MAG: transglycosylase domain-containing protein [Synergistaceae bacterium]|jgi:penicillin-binding protein 1C|nr:transglycosylase domain-containing protein [Synergistaceae bacterium]
MRRVLIIIGALLAAVEWGVGGAFLLTPPAPDLLDYPSGTALLNYDDEKWNMYYTTLSTDGEWHLSIPLHQMGCLPEVAVAVEDRRFYSHHGVDFRAIVRAAAQNFAAGHVVSGASTITCQVVRLLNDRAHKRPRTLATKFVECIQAIKLERRHSKDEILQAYLNNAPFGSNIRGGLAAAYSYFGKPADRLSLGEAAVLVGMLKAPSLYRPDLHPESSRRRRDAVLTRVSYYSRSYSDAAAAAAAVPVALPPNRGMPRRAFHFADMMIKNGVSGATTLDMDAQTTLEGLLSRAADALPESVTAAAGVMENATGALIAWVGNARFGTGAAASWVDCGLAPRSPGSLLKPFLYGAAFERGLLAPGELLADTPAAFSGRAPRNFDSTYRGAVSAASALSDSLNTPAVRVLRSLGGEETLRTLRSLGFDLERSAKYYGDSLILGGCEITLLQALRAYSALASSAALGADAPHSAACWLVSDILRKEGGYSLKTGTSYGLRDAWAAAWARDFTVVVWVGDPEGAPHSMLVGARAAAPLAADALKGIIKGRGKRGELVFPARPPAGKSVARRLVCSLSGRPPTPLCPSTRMDWSITGVTRSLPCDLHSRRGDAFSPGRASQPPVFSLTPKQTPHPAISIISPPDGATYFLNLNPGLHKMPLKADAPAWWYVDGVFAGKSEPYETLFVSTPPPGRHTVTALLLSAPEGFYSPSPQTPSEGREATARITIRR